jgi:transposase-like protein
MAAGQGFGSAFGDGELWLDIRAAIELAVVNQRSLRSAEKKLIEALASGAVRSRAWIRDPPTPGGIPTPGHILSLPAENWNYPDADPGIVLDGVKSILSGNASIQVNENDLRSWRSQQRRGRRGPVPGKIARYQQADEALFPELRRLLNEEHKTLTAATQELAWQGKVGGPATPESKAKRLQRAFRNSLLLNP